MNFLEQFKAARRVSTPLILVKTFDSASTVTNLRSALNGKAADTPLLKWDAVNGMIPLNNAGEQQLAAVLNGESPESTIVLPMTLKLASGLQEDSILFVSNAHLHWADPVTVQAIWNLRDIFKGNGNTLVLLASAGSLLPSELTHDVMILDEPLPTPEELAAIIGEVYKAIKQDPNPDIVAKATDALIGLPSFPSEQSVAMCLHADGSLDISELWNRKKQIVSQTPGLSIWSGKETLADVGGLESVKKFCRSIMTGRQAPKTIIFMDEIEKAFAGTGTDTSGVKTELTGSMLSWMQDKEIDGMIFIGLPGVSKSALVKSLGNDYNVPVINFDLAGMQSSLVGSSGANLRAAQKTVDAISGGNVLAIATCNGIQSLPPELRRRFNLGTFFFDAPSPSERAIIWDIYRRKFDIPSSDQLPNDSGFTGAEIRECCKKAYRLRLTLVESAEYIVPVTKSASDVIKALRLQCSNKYLSASKPGVYQYSEATEATPVRKIKDTSGMN